MKGVVFEPEPEIAPVSLKATEVDGGGAQGIFIHVRKNRKNRLGGLLLKYDMGIKDTWLTDHIPLSEVKSYYHQAFEDSVTLRDISEEYFISMVEHFLALNT